MLNYKEAQSNLSLSAYM